MITIIGDHDHLGYKVIVVIMILNKIRDDQNYASSIMVIVIVIMVTSVFLKLFIMISILRISMILKPGAAPRPSRTVSLENENPEQWLQKQVKYYDHQSHDYES